jgi:hypothetical protein
LYQVSIVRLDGYHSSAISYLRTEVQTEMPIERARVNDHFAFADLMKTLILTLRLG